MREPAAVVDVRIDELAAEVREALAAYREASAVAARCREELDKAATRDREAAQEAAARRLVLGRALVKIRPSWPERGPKAKGWGDFLAREGIDQDVALDAMKYAAHVDANPGTYRDRLPSRREAGLDPPPAEATADPDPADPADDAEGEGEDGDHDAYCTPEHITILLPEVDLDPCSNPRSTVRAKNTYSLEAGQDGLELPWFGLIFVNFPYSAPRPWAEKFERDRSAIGGAGFLVNADHSPAWWRILTRHLNLRLDFTERLQFAPPPGIVPSKNDRPQSLLMDVTFWEACKRGGLLKLGTLWTRTA